MHQWMIYGANGFTGRLMVEAALRKGLRPVIAGRSREEIVELGDETGLEHRIFDLRDPAATVQGLAELDAVVHCAGPFSGTAMHMVRACIASRTHYLDVGGEIPVYDAIRRVSGEAAKEGVSLAPGMAFLPAVSNCLANSISGKLSRIDEVRVALGGDGFMSRGTAATLVEILGRGGTAVRNGARVSLPIGQDTIRLESNGNHTAVSFPIIDLVPLEIDTNASEITTYVVADGLERLGVRTAGLMGNLLRSPGLARLTQRLVRSMGPSRPEAASLGQGASMVWVELRGAGNRVAAKVAGRDPYLLTAEIAVMAISRLGRDNEIPPGLQTPSVVLGPALFDEISGFEVTTHGPTEIEDVV